MTSLVTEKTTKMNVWQMPVVKVLAKKFGIGQWSFIGPGSEKKWYSGEEKSPQGAWDNIAEEMLLEYAEKRTSYFPSHDSVIQGYIQEQRTWTTVNTLHCRLSNN